MKKQIFLPKWVEPMAILHAKTVCEDELGLALNSPKYKTEFKKAFIKFCSEFHRDSLVPGIKSSNPIKAENPTWRGGINAFKEFEDSLFTGSNSFLSKRTGSEKERNEMSKTLRRAITSIVSVYLKAEMKTDKYGYNFISKKDSNKAEALMIAQKQRYERLAFISILLSHLEMIFKIKLPELEKAVNVGLKDKSWKELSTKNSHQKFSHAVREALKDELEASEPIELVKNYFQNKDFMKGSE